MVAVPVDGVVEFPGLGGHEGRHLIVDQPQFVAGGNRLGKGVDALVTDLFVDHRGQEPSGQSGVVGLLDDEGRGGPDREFVEFLGSRPVAEAGDGSGGDPHGVHSGEAHRAPFDGADDLVDVNRLEITVAFADPHPLATGRVLAGWFGDGLGEFLQQCHGLVIPSRHPSAPSASPSRIRPGEPSPNLDSWLGVVGSAVVPGSIFHACNYTCVNRIRHLGRAG